MILPPSRPPSQVAINLNFSNWTSKQIVLSRKSSSSVVSLLSLTSFLDSNPPSAEVDGVGGSEGQTVW